MVLFKDKEAREKIEDLRESIEIQRHIIASNDLHHTIQIYDRFDELYQYLGIERKTIPSSLPKTVLVKKKAKGKV